MQDLRPILTGIGNAGRFFGGDRRLRPYSNQALKCPRCDSLNTKFCYYNNYNLSQPRHFAGLQSFSISTITTQSSSSSVPPATPPGLLNFTDSRLFLNQETPNPNFESSSVLENLDQSTDAGGIFSDNGGFTNLMNVGNTYNFSDISPFRLNHQQQQHEEIDLQQEKM
ncbi:hypothetical protein ACHQM5_016557 [Ranunculus cassubicifolius]